MFQQYKSYYLQYPWSNIKLKLLEKGETQAVNKEEMPAIELLRKLVTNDYDYSFESSLGVLTVVTKGEVYSFDLLPPHCPYSKIIEMYLELGKKTKNFDEICYYRWLYIESDYVLEDPSSQFYAFFLCKGDNIVRDRMSLLVTSGDKLHDENLLIERNDYFFRNEIEDEAAHVRLLYEKWFKETLPGRIYAMKQKMELEKETRLLRNSLIEIRIALYILVAIAIYAVFIK